MRSRSTRYVLSCWRVLVFISIFSLAILLLASLLQTWWVGLAVLPVAALPVLATYWEITEFNGGVCAKNGVAWSLAQYDSQGGRLWVAEDQRLWISWLNEDAAAWRAK